MNLIRKLCVISCSLMFFLAMFVNSIIVAERSSLLTVEVVDIEQTPVQDLILYLVKDPISNPCFLSIMNISEAQFSLESGVYSVGAYAPNHGWDARIVELGERQVREVVLKVAPMVDEWIDKNGNQYTNLTEWPWTADIPPISASEKSSRITPNLYPNWRKTLVERRYYYNQAHKTGEVYSCPYLTVDLIWKFDSHTETVSSIQAGPLQVTGYTVESAVELKNYPDLSNGESRTIYHEFDDCYEVWYYEWIGPKNGEPENYYEEVWYESHFYGGTSGWYSTPYPSPTYKDHADRILNAVDYPPDEQAPLCIKFGEMEGGGFGVGQTFTFPIQNWSLYVGPVSLGASYYVKHYEAEEKVYDFKLWGGHKVNVYYWNINVGCMITYNLTHVPLTVLAQDQYNNPLTTGDVYIDDELVGYTGSTFTVEAGTHRVWVNHFWENGNTGYRYGFKNWTDGVVDNPRNIAVFEDTVITARFKKKWCPGDANGDGIVNIYDAVLVTSRYGKQRIIGAPWPTDGEWDSRADLNRDLKIDLYDLTRVTSNYGRRYPDP